GRWGASVRAMALPPPRRALFVDERGAGMRVSWHAERGVVVLSLWRDDVCVGSFRLPVEEVSRLTTFLVGHLGDLAAASQAGGGPDTDEVTRPPG
ncbi:MAG TPA: hypothetical protein VM324_09875, partial [Egibacteraceae bacterium]|nr:hypothetical protein [Egibacteraceae bacterium]